MNKKSFICGVFVGVLITWALSFYLYYSLINSQSLNLSGLQKNIFNFDDDSGESEEQKNSNSLSDKDDKAADGKASYVKGKANKDKEKRKISRKLIEELTPVTIKQQEEFGKIKSIDDQFTRDHGYKTHAFNILVSNNIGNFRDIPDTRHRT